MSAASRSIRCCSTSAPESPAPRSLPWLNTPTRATSSRICSCRCGTGGSSLRDRMPRRFYCRARWQTGDATQRDTGLRPRLRGSGWSRSRGNSRVRGETRTARGIVAQSRRRCDPAAVQHRLARGRPAGVERWTEPRKAPGWSPDSTNSWRNCRVPSGSSRASDPQDWVQLLAQAQERGVPFSGIVWGVSRRGSSDEPSAEFVARTETEIGSLVDVGAHACWRSRA